jgi:hypothetical protein
MLKARDRIQVDINDSIVFVRDGVKPSKKCLADFSVISVMVIISMTMTVVISFLNYK